MELEKNLPVTSGAIKVGKTDFVKEMCEDALKKDGQVWVLSPAETHSKEVGFLSKSFIGESVATKKRPQNQPVQICHTILDGIVSSLYAASDAEIERAGLVLSVLCETGVDLDFIFAEVRTVILNLKSKGGQRYRLKDIATALMQRSHPDAIALGAEMLKLPLKFAYWVSYSSRQKFSIHALNPLNFSAENKTYTILAIFDFIDFMTGLMQMELGDVTPQVLVIDELYRHISADSEILRRLMRNVAEALKTVNAVVLITELGLCSSEKNYQEVK